ncbi:molecular chaperone [Lelliottia aquatilis]|uniref:fimbrial biogenesis chaperone n=1 Tax=Lelliottia aquatilis TaxID=2080838 RepID=UPI000CDECBD2|nr:molecular chaperone [Lelliottia aquatilis]POZ13811.1 molecular chaperone [Lelliottia aquatilis]
MSTFEINKKPRYLAVLLAALILCSAASIQAADNKGGISLGGTRLVFEGGKEAASMTVTNSSAADVWLMRFWISPYGDSEDKSGEESGSQTMPFAVTPPLYRLDPQNAVQLRVNKLVENLPADRESVYYLNNLAIPPKKGEKSYQKSVQSGLQFAVNTRIKLFYRPAAIDDPVAVKQAPEKLTVASSGKDIVVKNPTPYFVTMTQLQLNGKPAKAPKDTMVLPFGELWLVASAAHGTLSYTTVDDRGMTTAKLSKSF